MRTAAELIFTFIGTGLVSSQLLLDIGVQQDECNPVQPLPVLDVSQNCAPQEVLTLQRPGPSFRHQNAEKMQELPVILCL